MELRRRATLDFLPDWGGGRGDGRENDKMVPINAVGMVLSVDLF